MNNLENLETIENYLNGQLPTDERAQFETALRTDPAVADALAFYVLTKEAARRQAREQRIAELRTLHQTPVPQPTRSAPMRWVAAASVVLLLGIGWFFFQNGSGSADSAQMADAYITKNYGQLTKTMSGGPADRLKQGIEFYGNGQLPEAEAAFEQVLAQKPDDEQALKYAGIVAYRRGNYDQAIERFHRLSERTDLLDQSGPFLEALAHIKRNQPIDKAQAKNLLERVIRENLDGKEEAEKLLNEL